MAPLASGPPCYPAIGTSNSDSRWTRHGRLPDILAMSPEPWQHRHCRSSSGEVQNAESRKRANRYGSGGDASGDIEPDRATRRWHCSAPAIARAAPPLRERRVGRPPPQGLRPVSWLASSCSSPKFIQVRGADRGFTRFNGDSTVADALRSTFCSFRKMRSGPGHAIGNNNDQRFHVIGPAIFPGITSPLWVTSGKARSVQMFSALLPKADFRSAIYEYTP
jgi:hypothetical protein